MNKMYTEVSIFTFPAIIIAAGYLYAGVATLLLTCSVYYFSGGRYETLNFDGKLMYRAVPILLYGLSIELINDPTYEILAFAIFVPLAFYVFRPVEENLKRVKNH